MALDTLTVADVEQVLRETEAAPDTPEALAPIAARLRTLTDAALRDLDCPGKVPRLIRFAENCLTFAADPIEAAKYLRLAVGALQERAKRVPVRPPLPAA